MASDQSNRGAAERRYLDDDFRDAVRRLGPATTSQVADEVSCSERTALLRLTELRDGDEIQSQRVGQAHLWSVVEE